MIRRYSTLFFSTLTILVVLGYPTSPASAQFTDLPFAVEIDASAQGGAATDGNPQGNHLSIFYSPPPLPFANFIQSTSTSFNQTVSTSFLDPFGSGGSASITVNTISSLGHLQGLFLTNAAAVGPFGVAGGSGTVSERWQDTFTVVSPTLPPGTPVQLRAMLSLSSSVTESLPFGGSGGVTGASLLICTAPGNPNSCGTLFGTGVGLSNIVTVPASGGEATSGGPQTLDGDDPRLHVFVGDTFILEGAMSLNSNARVFNCVVVGNVCTPPPFSTSFGRVDAFNSAQVFLDVLTPGAAYTTASGQTYATPITTPEPSTWLLLGTGLLGMVWWRKRRGIGSRRDGL